MNNKQKFITEKIMGKAVRILFIVLLMVISICVLSVKVPEMKYVDEAIENLDKSRDRVMTFSGATLTASTAVSLLPKDWANPLANSLADMNKYFVFMFAVIFLEKLIVVEGIRISFVYMIPAACILYILSILFSKEKMKEWAIRFLILGMAVIGVVPFSIHFTQKVGDNYLAYVDETIEEANAGAQKIYEVKSVNEEEDVFLDKISDMFVNAFQGVKDLFTYFNNLIKKCINSIAVMIVITFIVPLFILVFFRWLLKELFSLHLNISVPQIKENDIVKKLSGKCDKIDMKKSVNDEK